MDLFRSTWRDLSRSFCSQVAPRRAMRSWLRIVNQVTLQANGTLSALVILPSRVLRQTSAWIKDRSSALRLRQQPPTIGWISTAWATTVEVARERWLLCRYPSRRINQIVSPTAAPALSIVVTGPNQLHGRYRPMRSRESTSRNWYAQIP